MRQQQLLHNTPPQLPMIEESCRGVTCFIQGFWCGVLGAIAKGVVTHVREHVTPTTDVVHECDHEIGVIQLVTKQDGSLTVPTVDGDLEEFHHHVGPVKSRYAVSKRHNQSENMHSVGIYIYIYNRRNKATREICNAKPIDW